MSEEWAGIFLVILTLWFCVKIYSALTDFFDKSSFTNILAGQNKPVLTFPCLWILSLLLACSSFFFASVSSVDKQIKYFWSYLKLIFVRFTKKKHNSWVHFFVSKKWIHEFTISVPVCRIYYCCYVTEMFRAKHQAFPLILVEILI